MVRLAVRVRREDAELVLAELLELAPSGVEEKAVGEDLVEYAVYGAPGEVPALPDVRAAVGDALVEVSAREIPDDWAERWREFHRPLVLEGTLTVRPPWEPAADTPIDLVIDPGQAFGTGAHATTRMCLELMVTSTSTSTSTSISTSTSPSTEAPGSFVDLGCGSGVLAIAAARLGWDPVRALDNDPASVAAAGENAARNGVTLRVSRHDLRSGRVPVADTVAANLLGPLLRSLADRLAHQPELPHRLIAGGLLRDEADGVAAAFAASRLLEADRRVDGDWAALLLERDTRG